MRSPSCFLVIGFCSILSVLTGAGATIPIFVFGDSLADNGNNNNLSVPLKDKANFPHNGIDFPGNIATGRFSNGLNTVDYIAKFLGYLRGPPSYSSVKGTDQMAHGVNFASGGSGILDTTGPGTISMMDQIKNFEKVVQVLEQTLGKKEAQYKITTSIFLIITANNDMFEYYYATRAANETLNEQFINSLVDKFTQHITSLYNLGARYFGISGTGIVGCVPYLTSQNPTGICIDTLNQVSTQYNAAASARLSQLSSQHPGMLYAYADTYRITSDMKETPILFGISDTQNACCGGGKFNGEVQCTPQATYCPDRDDHFYWDWFHPTEATCKKIALLSVLGSLIYTAPINIQQLAMEITLSNSGGS